MPLGLKLLVDQRLQPVCVESFVGLRPQRRCRSGAERFAFQSRAGTGGYFTTGTSARPPLPLSLRAGDAAAAGEGSLLGQGRVRLLCQAEPPNSPGRVCWDWEGLVQVGKVLVELGGCREDGGAGGRWGMTALGSAHPSCLPPRISLAVPAVPSPGQPVTPRVLPRPVSFSCGHCKPFPETSRVWVWAQVPFFLLSPLQCLCQ